MEVFPKIIKNENEDERKFYHMKKMVGS